MNTDIIGGFTLNTPNCLGCGNLLEKDNAWMTDGCPCNSPLGCNNQNEQRWRLLMELQQEQSRKLEEARKIAKDTISTLEIVDPGVYPTVIEELQRI